MNSVARGGWPSKMGFTLLELLVVIAVISLLSALIFATLASIRRKGFSAQSVNNLRQLAAANTAYANDWGTYVPASDRQNLHRWHGTRTSASQPFDAAQGFLSPYLGRDKRVIPCPLLALMMAKQGQTFEDGSGGYGYNEIYLGGMRDSITDKNGVYVPIPTARIQHPSTTIMFTTSAYAQADGVQEYPFAEPPFWDFGFGPDASRPSPSVHFRFDGRAIVVWCDGHTSLEKLRRNRAASASIRTAATRRLNHWDGSGRMRTTDIGIQTVTPAHRNAVRSNRVVAPKRGA